MPLTTYTSGEVLTAASLNVNLVFAAANPVATPGALVFISATTIGTTVGSVTVSGAFSTTYDNYKIVVSGGLGSATIEAFQFSLGATATGYYWGRTGRTWANTDQAAAGSNAAFWTFGGISTDALNMTVELFNPFVADQTLMAGSYMYASAASGMMFNSGGMLNNTTSYTAFTLTPNSGTVTGGTIYVYGYAKA